MTETPALGSEIYRLAQDLFPFCRSIMGEGVRQTLRHIKSQHLPDLQIHEVPTGTKCFDWEVPEEWNIRDAYILTPSKEKIADFKRSNLHVMNYSIPVAEQLSLEKLNFNLYSLPEKPHAIPYVTSYYKRRWGFCLSHNERSKLSEGNYYAYIDSEIKPGSMTYAELLIPGSSKEEVLVSTYTCHPSLANNETSGPCLATFLAKAVAQKKNRYTYRFVFVPETIGAIMYLSKHLEHLKRWVKAGFQITCVGDNRAFSYMPSRNGNTLTDRLIQHVLSWHAPEATKYSFLERGSDERQYCAPGVDLPVASLMRSKYASYPEYHTSDDDLSLISAEGFQGAYDLHLKCFEILEHNARYQATNYCEPMLSKYDLRSTIGAGGLAGLSLQASQILAYSDGKSDLLQLADAIKYFAGDLIAVVDLLETKGLLKRNEI